MTNTGNFFVSLGLLENFDHGVYVFLVAIAVVQDRLRSQSVSYLQTINLSSHLHLCWDVCCA